MPKIFESPDKGATVYMREAGKTDRTIYEQMSQAYFARKQKDELVDLFDKLFEAADHDPELKELLEKAVMYYNLKYA